MTPVCQAGYGFVVKWHSLLNLAKGIHRGMLYVLESIVFVHWLLATPIHVCLFSSLMCQNTFATSNTNGHTLKIAKPYQLLSSLEN